MYGLPSILGRLLNFLLVPIHTAAMARGEFGIVTDLYVWVAVLIVLLTYGMETAYFYHGSKSQSQDQVFATAQFSLLFTTAVFYFFFEWRLEAIAHLLRYEGHEWYLRLMVWILCLDVLAALPFARLRLNGKAVWFVAVKMSLIGVNILANLYFFWWMAPGTFALPFFEAGDLVGYVLLANGLASMTMLFLLLPQFKPLLLWRTFDGVLLRKMLLYGLPLMLAGLAGIANELADRQFLKYLLPEATSMDDLGIYGAIYKLSIFLVLFVQAYRYAAEPFFFRLDSETGDSRQMNARVLRYFTLVLGAVVIGLNAALPVIKHFIDEKFWAGLQAAPILFAANFVLGLNTHLSIWYKLANKTWFAGIVTGVGLLFTIGLNLWWIPQMGWMGAAWATFISYLVMAILNALLGRKYAPVPYAWKVLLTYFISSLLLGFFAWKVQALWGLWALLALLPYLMIVLLIERSTWQHILPQRK